MHREGGPRALLRNRFGVLTCDSPPYKTAIVGLRPKIARGLNYLTD